MDTVEPVANHLVSLSGETQRAVAGAVEIQERRQRNLTLLGRGYAQLRRAVAYLFWQDGALLEAGDSSGPGPHPIPSANATP